MFDSRHLPGAGGSLFEGLGLPSNRCLYKRGVLYAVAFIGWYGGNSAIPCPEMVTDPEKMKEFLLGVADGTNYYHTVLRNICKIRDDGGLTFGKYSKIYHKCTSCVPSTSCDIKAAIQKDIVDRDLPVPKNEKDIKNLTMAVLDGDIFHKGRFGKRSHLSPCADPDYCEELGAIDSEYTGDTSRFHVEFGICELSPQEGDRCEVCGLNQECDLEHFNLLEWK